MAKKARRGPTRDLTMHSATSRSQLPIDPVTGMTDYNKIKVGVKVLEDAVITTPLKKVKPNFSDKEFILKAIANNDVSTMRDISLFYYRVSGIYSRLCNYLARLYRYDWYVVPYISGGDTYPSDSEKGDIDSKNVNKILDNFFKVLRYLDNFKAKHTMSNIALRVMKEGVYYGYIIFGKTAPSIQELSPQYCRSRYSQNGMPVIEFNMRYFKDLYPDEAYRSRILKMFPDDFAKGYRMYINGKLPGDFAGDTAGWYMLDPKCAFKLNLNESDYPPLINVIPAIIDLVEAQEMDRKRMAQKLLKIIVQQLPLDKNGDMIFDLDEAQQIHNNAVKMLSRAIGIDVLTTFADVEVADMADRNTTTTVDDLEKVERTVFNEAGISQMQFNTDGNLAIEKSMINDSAMMSNLVYQFEAVLNMILINFNGAPKKVYYTANILPTTVYDYKELSKLYKEQTQMGYSKMLPQIAMGLSQSSILANAFFENDLLNLVTVFVPPLTSNTMNADALAQQQTGRRRQGLSVTTGNPQEGAGRPEKPDDQKSEKTIQNLESQS